MDRAKIAKNAKLIGIAVVALLVLIVILQNVKPIETRILFVTIQMPRALLLFLTFLLGAGFGFLSGTFYSRRRQAEDKDEKKKATG